MSGTTTNLNNPDIDRGPPDDTPVPQNKKYLVLSEEEIAKGYVKPWRNKYLHVGRSICAKIRPTDEKRLGGSRDVCSLRLGHEGECSSWRPIGQHKHAEILNTHRENGCGTETKMRDAIASTYAADPCFYGATYCVGCQKHRPLCEFTWLPDGEPMDPALQDVWETEQRGKKVTIESGDTIEMPRWQCHKIVHGLKIKSVLQGMWSEEKTDYNFIIQPEDDRYEDFVVDGAYFNKHLVNQPNHGAGGYYVVYNRGEEREYASWSPADVYEDGYTEIT